MIISVPLLTFGVRKRQKFFCKMSQKVYPFWISPLYIERWNSKGRSGYSFDSIYKIYFAAFLHRSLFVVIQIWLTHQSKALIFYFGMKNFFNLIFENLWKTDKLNFTSSNLMCVYTHSKFQNMKFSLSVFHKTFKNQIKKVFHAKIENLSFWLMG